MYLWITFIEHHVLFVPLGSFYEQAPNIRAITWLDLNLLDCELEFYFRGGKINIMSNSVALANNVGKNFFFFFRKTEISKKERKHTEKSRGSNDAAGIWLQIFGKRVFLFFSFFYLKVEHNFVNWNCIFSCVVLENTCQETLCKVESG